MRLCWQQGGDDETDAYLVAVPLVDSVMKAAGVDDYEVVKTLDGRGLAGACLPASAVSSHVAGRSGRLRDDGRGNRDRPYRARTRQRGLRDGPEVRPGSAEARGCGRTLHGAAGEYGGRSSRACASRLGRQKRTGRGSQRRSDRSPARSPATCCNATKFEHSYPHCWRCHSPLIFRATVQWFMNIDHEVGEGKGKREKEKSRRGVTLNPQPSTLQPFLSARRRSTRSTT